VSNAIGRWRAELIQQVVDHLVGPQIAAGEDRQQTAGEEDLAGGAQLDVAQRPLAIGLGAAFALEVDGDRPPVADEIVEQEPRRAVVAGAAVHVGVQHPLERMAVMLRAGRADGFQQEQHAAREVLVGVLIQADAACEILHMHLGAEGALRAGARAVPAHDLREISEVRGDGRAGELGIERELCARHGFALGRWRTLGGGVQEQPVQIAGLGHLGAPPGSEQHHAGLLRQTNLSEVVLQAQQPELAAPARGKERREARGAPRRQVLQCAERCLRAILHQAAAFQNH
jgi:hypothetical protein